MGINSIPIHWYYNKNNIIMEAKVIELKPLKNYIDKNHLDVPMIDKVLVDFIQDMVNKKNKS